MSDMRVAKAKDAEEFKGRIPEAISIVPKYADVLMSGRARADDLAIYRQLSRHPLAYEVEARTAIAARQMLDAGIELQPGQTIAYVITRAGAKKPDLRVRALPLIGMGARYDGQKYLDLLLDAAEELFGPFGYDKERVRAEGLSQTKQIEF